MTMLWGEGFETYGTNGTNILTELAKELTISGSRAVTLEAGRFGGQRIRMSSYVGGKGSEETTFERALGVTVPSSGTLIVGFHLVRSASTDYGAAPFFFTTSNGNTIWLSQTLNSWECAQGTIASFSSSYSLPSAADVYLEFKLPINSVGSSRMRVNGVEYSPNSSNQTRMNNTIASGINRASFRSFQQSTGSALDDIYVNDNTGSTFNDFITDAHKKTFKAAQLLSTAGQLQSWVTSTGSNQADLIKEYPIADAGYLQSNAVGAKSSFYMPNDFYDLGQTNTLKTIEAVLIKARAKKIPNATSELEIMTRASSTNTAAGSWVISASFANYNLVLPTNPSTGVAWAIADFGASGAQLVINTKT